LCSIGFLCRMKTPVISGGNRLLLGSTV
jgi:hypothetical protein